MEQLCPKCNEMSLVLDGIASNRIREIWYCNRIPICDYKESIELDGRSCLREVVSMVREFHIKNGYKLDSCLIDEVTDFSDENCVLEITLGGISAQLQMIHTLYQEKACKAQKLGDARLYRTLLMVEELGEVIQALTDRDEVAYADGLGDLMYVTIGSAITNNIPLSEVFAEIQKANMAKKKKSDDDPRMRDKGENWKRPDIKGAIKRGRRC